jgi:predicted NodU family carbamoyl transferase
MKILGINISHDFSICIYENNKIKDLWYEERFNLNKNWFIDNTKEFKHHLISIFQKINFKPDLVCYSSFYRDLTHKINNDYKIIENIQKQLDNPNYFFNIRNHHIYHSLNSFYFSKFDEAMSIVIDGGGSQPFDDLYQEIESIFYLNKKVIYLLYQHLSNRRFIKADSDLENYSDYRFVRFEENTEYLFTSESAGGFDFSRACSLIGFKNSGHDAGKLMGLSSYANTNIKYNLNYKHVELAKKTQEKSFIATCKLIEKAHEYKKIKNFVLSGGYFLNCSNNFKYIKKYPEFNFFVDPIPHDGGTAIGACIYYDKYR